MRFTGRSLVQGSIVHRQPKKRRAEVVQQRERHQSDGILPRLSWQLTQKKLHKKMNKTIMETLPLYVDFSLKKKKIMGKCHPFGSKVIIILRSTNQDYERQERQQDGRDTEVAPRGRNGVRHLQRQRPEGSRRAQRAQRHGVRQGERRVLRHQRASETARGNQGQHDTFTLHQKI